MHRRLVRRMMLADAARPGVRAIAVLCMVVPAWAGTAWAQTSDLAAAQKQFVTSCAVCHAVEPGAPPRQGPNLSDRFGKPAATLEGFKYSEALTTSGFVWNEETMDRWITDSQAMRPGVTMPYRQADPAKRRLIIDYLKSLSGKS